MAQLPTHQDAVRLISDDVEDLCEGSMAYLDRTEWLGVSSGARWKLFRHSTEIPGADLYLSGFYWLLIIARQIPTPAATLAAVIQI
jgi:hypothetical protein